jgi:hypothetical protein
MFPPTVVLVIVGLFEQSDEADSTMAEGPESDRP